MQLIKTINAKMSKWGIYLFSAFILAIPLIVNLRNYFSDYNYPPLNPAYRYILIAFLSAFFLSYIIFCSKYRNASDVKRTVLMWILLLLAYCMLIPPLFSIDLYEYVMRGRMSALYSLNPFLHSPQYARFDPLYNVIFWKYAVSAYGPVWNMLTFSAVALSGDIVSSNIFCLKYILLFLHITSGLLIFRICRNMGDRDKIYTALLYLLNPYLVFMNLIENHNDIVMVIFVLVAIYMLSSGKFILSTVFLTFSAGAKYISIIFLPLFLIYIYKGIKTNRQKMLFTAKIILINTAILAVMWLPYGFPLNSVFSDLQGVKLRLDTNSLPFLSYYILQRIPSGLDISMFRKLSDVSFMIFSLMLYLSFFIRKDKNLRSLMNFCVIQLAGYFVIASFQMGSWYFVWMAPILLLSSFKRKYVLFFIVTFLALLSFWKRMNFLLVGGLFLYLIYDVIERRYVAASPGKRELR